MMGQEVRPVRRPARVSFMLGADSQAGQEGADPHRSEIASRSLTFASCRLKYPGYFPPTT